MIPKGTNVVVNFYATDSAGVPLSRASGITPYYRLNGGASDPLGCNIYSLGNDAPGWFRFSTSHFNTSTGNLFITFSNNSGYIIMPWEDDIVPTGGASAADIWNYSFSGSNASSYLYTTNISADDAAYYAQSAYSKVSNIGTSFASISNSVWSKSLANGYVGEVINTIYDWVAELPDSSTVASAVWGDSVNYLVPSSSNTKGYAQLKPPVWGQDLVVEDPYRGSIPTTYGSVVSDFYMYIESRLQDWISVSLYNYGDRHWYATDADEVWGYSINGSSASTYLGSIGNLATSTDITNATNTITDSIGGIAIPTPPDANTIAASVWGYGTASSRLIGNVIPTVTDIWGDSSARSLTYYPDFPTVPTTGDIATSVWGHAIGGSSASVYLGSISGLATTNNITAATDTITTSIGSIGGWATTADITDATNTITGSIGAIIIPTPPDATTIAASVWAYGNGSERIVNNTIPSVEDIWGNSSGWRTLTSYPVFPTTTSIATSVWSYVINGKSASSYISSIGNLPTSSSIWSYTSRTLTSYPDYPSVIDIQAGLAKTTDITGLQTHGDNNWVTATGFAVSTDIPAPNTIASSVWNYTDGSRLVDNTIPVPADTAAIAASVWNYTDGSRLVDNDIPEPVEPNTIAASVWGYGTASSRLIGNTIPTVTDIWGDSSVRSLTYYPDFPTVPTTGDIATSVWGYPINGSSASTYLGSIGGWATSTDVTNATNTITASIGNIGGWATPADVTGVITHGDISWKTATGFATPGAAMTLTAAYDAAKITPPSVDDIQAGLATVSDVSTLQTALSKLYGGLFNWSINYGTLTVSVDESIYLYSVTRDMSGNITAIVPSV